MVAGENTGVAEVPITFFPRKTPGLQQAFRLRESDWSASLAVEALGQSIQSDVFHLYSLKTGGVSGSVLINYFVVGAPATEWKISVPAEIGNIDVTGQNVGRDWRRDGDTVIVPLSRPLLGAGTVLLTFEQPMPSSGGELSPGQIRPLDVQAERGFVQIVSPLQVKFSAPTSKGPLLKIDPTELPAEFRLLSSAPTLAAWQYTARDFTIGTKVEWYDQGETVDQVVDFLKLSTQISRDGQWVTDARFFVKSKGRAALRAILPEGTSLWEAMVDGTPVNARADGNETLIPIPTQADPNRAVEITLRYGASSENPAHPTLTAPALDAPLVIGEWTVTGDENRVLVARGGDLRSPQATAPTGWQTLSTHRPAVVILLILGVTAVFLKTGDKKSTTFIAATASAVFIIIAILLALKTANTSHLTTPTTLTFNNPVVPAGQAISLEIDNLPIWQARTGLNVWLLFLAGTTITLVGLFKKGFIWKFAGLALVAASFLSIRGGASLFFLVLALIALVSIPWRRILSAMPKPKPASSVTAALILLSSLVFIQTTRAAEDFKPAESITQTWQIEDNRLQAIMEITLRATEGDRFLLLKSPATLTNFTAQGLTVSKREEPRFRNLDNPEKDQPKPKAKSTTDHSALGTDHSYIITATATGSLTATATYEMPLTLANPAQPWLLPTGPAAMRKITIRYDQSGYEFISAAAAKTTPLPGLNESESGAILLLGPQQDVTITARPTQRDIVSEDTKFFSEVSNLFLPGAGVVTARHHVSIRPAQGRVSNLLLKIPAGFTVSDVGNGQLAHGVSIPKNKNSASQSNPPNPLHSISPSALSKALTHSQ